MLLVISQLTPKQTTYSLIVTILLMSTIMILLCNI